MRGVVKFLLSLIVGIALIWIGFWWYAEHRLQSGFEAWAEQQAANGWKVAFDSVRRGTSPMNAAIAIDHLQLTPPPGPDGEVFSISVPNVTLRIAAMNPLVYHTDLPPQIALTIGNTVGVIINSGSIAFSENLDPDSLFNPKAYPFRGGDFAAGNVDILASSLLVLHIDGIRSHADLDPKADAHAAAVSGSLTLDGVTLSPLLTRIASVPFGGRLAHLSLTETISGPVPAGLPALADRLNALQHDRLAQRKLLVPVVHQWASQGGSGKIALNLNIGPSTVAAAAALSFDAGSQPAGTADFSADRLGAFTTALTNSYPALLDDVARTEAQLSPYLSNTQQGGQTLQMHVVYGAGNVAVNGQKVAALPQLDWAALENPPAPVQAPGDGSGADVPPGTP